jgi:hypothetical protein
MDENNKTVETGTAQAGEVSNAGTGTDVKKEGGARQISETEYEALSAKARLADEATKTASNQKALADAAYTLTNPDATLDEQKTAFRLIQKSKGTPDSTIEGMMAKVFSEEDESTQTSPAKRKDGGDDRVKELAGQIDQMKREGQEQRQNELRDVLSEQVMSATEGEVVKSLVKDLGLDQNAIEKVKKSIQTSIQREALDLIGRSYQENPAAWATLPGARKLMRQAVDEAAKQVVEERRVFVGATAGVSGSGAPPWAREVLNSPPVEHKITSKDVPAVRQSKMKENMENLLLGAAAREEVRRTI